MDDPKKEPIEAENEEATLSPVEGDDIELEKDEEFVAFSAAKNKDVVLGLRQKLKQSDEEKREYLLGWQKMKADYINSRKQDEEEKRAVIKFAEADVITEIIPVLDSFEMALANEKSLAEIPEEWRRGMEQIRNQLKGILVEHGLKVIDPQDAAFNPHESEAVGIAETDDAGKDDMVAAVLQKGYKLHDRVIRPAKVKVWKHN